MKLLVFGRTGQVAAELGRRLPAGVSAELLGRDRVDLADPAACAAAIAVTDAHAVVNAAAWTAVDRAEAEEAAAMVVNAEAPGAMARACAARGLPFLHLSSDYVFDGTGDVGFGPGHLAAPLSAYGRTKLAGEIAIRAAGGAHLILRTSWVFSIHGVNFVKTMLRLSSDRPALRVVADQVGGPTSAAAIADALITCAWAMIGGAPGGTHHFAGAPDISWAGFARAIIAAAGFPCAVEDIASSDYPTPTRRPLNSRLDCSGFTAGFGIHRPDWRRELHNVLSELGAIP